MSARPLVCPRCAWPGARGTCDARTLEAHLVEAHFLKATKAKAEVEAAAKAAGVRTSVPAGVSGYLVTPTSSKLPPAPATVSLEEHHTCPRCHTIIDCDLASLFTLEQQAARLKILAGMWRARLNGKKIGSPRRNTFDVEVARRLVAEGMTYQAVAETLGASSYGAVKSQLARLRRAERKGSTTS